MRQAGIIAAAGIIALEKMTGRLREDHENALYLSNKLSEIPGIEVIEGQSLINMVFFRLKGYPLDSPALVEYLAGKNVVINGEDNGVMRFVTHHYVTKEEIDFVVTAMREAI